MLHTRLCTLLGIDAPIFCAPMGPDLTGPALTAAVSRAGGLGLMQAQLHPLPLLREQIRQVKAETDRPFGVNFILRFPSEAGIDVCLDEGVPVISLYQGDPAPFVRRIHEAGARLIYQASSVGEARRAAEAGADVIIAQGTEAGGHVYGDVSTLALVPRVVDAVAPTPVAAAGGIADARGLVAVLALGAEGAVLGTRFLATPEAFAHPLYKQRLLGAREQDTVRTTLFGHGWPHAPHRVLRTAFVERWLSDEARGSEERPDEPVIGQVKIGGQTMPLHRFMGFPPNADATGEIESMDLLAGQGVGLIEQIKPAATIVHELVEGARRIIAERLNDTLGWATPA